MSREGLRAAAIVASVVAVSASLFLTCFERRTVEIPSGFSREALADRYLAARRLLEQMGHEVRTLQGPAAFTAPEALPPADGTLVFPRSRRTLTPAHSRALLDWAEGGGHLVAVTYSLWDDPLREPDGLLDPLGLRQYEHVFEDEDDEATEPAGAGTAEPDDEEGEELEPAGAEAAPEDGEADVEAAPGDDEPEQDEALVLGEAFAELDEPAVWDVCEVSFPGLDEPLRVQFDPRFYWVDVWEDTAFFSSCAWGSHLLTIERGDGFVTALTDEFFLRNGRIGELDHAELTVRLARMGGRRGPVWIVLGEEWPGLWSQAREHAAPAVVGLAALVLAWLWRASRRFGPLLPPPAPERRRWLEHLEAVGRHHWREDRGRFLLERMRARLEQLFEQRHPVWASLPRPRRIARIAEISGLSEEEVARAFDQDFHPGGEAGFVATVVDLERIRTSL